jgi:WD40 repeat protein
MMEGKSIEALHVTGDKALVRTASSVASWDLRTFERTPLLSWQSGLALGVPSPDGQRVIAMGPKWTLELRDRQSKAPVLLAGHRGMISKILWSHDGSTAYSSSYDGTLRKWDLATGKGTVLVEGDVPVKALAVSADDRIAVQVGEDAMIIDPSGRGTTVATGPAGCAAAAEFDVVHDRLMIQRCDHGFEVIDGERLVNLQTDGTEIEKLAVSTDGERIAGAMSDRTIRVWDVHGGLVKILRGHSDLVLDVAFSPDGSELASASYDKTIRIWQLATGRHRVIRGHTGGVAGVAWRGPEQVVSASYDGTVQLWPVPTLDPPSQDQVSRRLEDATTTQIDAKNLATTVGS